VLMQTARPLTMKKEGLQTRKRKQKGVSATGKSKSKSSKCNHIGIIITSLILFSVLIRKLTFTSTGAV